MLMNKCLKLDKLVLLFSASLFGSEKASILNLGECSLIWVVSLLDTIFTRPIGHILCFLWNILRQK